MPYHIDETLLRLLQQRLRVHPPPLRTIGVKLKVTPNGRGLH